jgi:hypothetical protein
MIINLLNIETSKTRLNLSILCIKYKKKTEYVEFDKKWELFSTGKSNYFNAYEEKHDKRYYLYIIILGYRFKWNVFNVDPYER